MEDRIVAPAAPNAGLDFSGLDFAGIDVGDARQVCDAIARGENFHGYIPSESFGFIVRNYRALAGLGALEPAWLDAYVHASHYDGFGFDVLRAIFDACDRTRLLALKPLGETVALAQNGRITLFRGCAGPVHHKGLSWTSSLDKAIWYAARHAVYSDIGNVAAYAATLDVAEIYCRLDHYDIDLIACPSAWWRVDVPADEFRLDRSR
jgi:hypothetical protein